MEIYKKFNGDTLEVALTDKLDTVTSQTLSSELEGDAKKAKSIVFDFEKLNYISSAGLRLLISYQKALGGKDKVVVKNANAVVKNIFKVTGFINLITVE